MTIWQMRGRAGQHDLHTPMFGTVRITNPGKPLPANRGIGTGLQKLSSLRAVELLARAWTKGA